MSLSLSLSISLLPPSEAILILLIDYIITKRVIITNHECRVPHPHPTIIIPDSRPLLPRTRIHRPRLLLHVLIAPLSYQGAYKVHTRSLAVEVGLAVLASLGLGLGIFLSGLSVGIYM